MAGLSPLAGVFVPGAAMLQMPPVLGASHVCLMVFAIVLYKMDVSQRDRRLLQNCLINFLAIPPVYRPGCAGAIPPGASQYYCQRFAPRVEELRGSYVHS